MAAAPAAAFTERLLHVVLYIAVLASSVAFIEPSPHDFLMGLLALACLIAGVRFERPIVLLLVLLLLWNVAGMVSLIKVVGEEQTVQYAATSVYLGIAALLFACLFAQNTVPRLNTMRSAYVLTAILCTLFGLAVYLHFLPGEDTFLWSGRIRSTFKDPNVFGPFLILPALFLIEQMVTRGVKLRHLAGSAILLLGLVVFVLAWRLAEFRGGGLRHAGADHADGTDAQRAHAPRHPRRGVCCRPRIGAGGIDEHRLGAANAAGARAIGAVLRRRQRRPL